MIISYEESMEWKFEKPISKILSSFHRKSRIIKYSLDLPLENMIGKHEHDVIWPRVAYRNIMVRGDSTAR